MTGGTRDYFTGPGGDDNPRQELKSPFSWRASTQNYSAAYSDYTGASRGGSVSLYGTLESRESRGHPVSWLGRSTGNIGGKFAHTRLQVDKIGSRHSPYSTGATWRNGNAMWAASSGFTSDLTPSPTHDYEDARDLVATSAPMVSIVEMDARGTTAIARVSPTNPLVDLSTSAAELLREGLPQVPGNAGNLGGEYLNVQFGYLPLYGDARDLAAVARRHDELLRQYERDSGRWIRRKYEFPPQVETTVETRGAAVPAPLGTSISGLVQTGTRTRTTTSETTIWFEGAFTYYLPRKGWRRTVASLDHLYGIRPGIDSAWNLLGYSWLVDYFSNVGDVMSNITAFKQDGLVMPYGYVMAKRVTTVEEDWTGPMRFGTWETTSVTSKKTYISHQRRQATPFGFGLELDGLTGRQLSILAALGISRM